MIGQSHFIPTTFISLVPPLSTNPGWCPWARIAASIPRTSPRALASGATMSASGSSCALASSQARRSFALGLGAMAGWSVPIIGLNYKDKPDAALGFLRDLGNPYAAIGADESGRMGIDWGIYGVPETFIIDGEGKVVLRFPGPITERVIDDVIRDGIKKAAAE